MFEVFDEGFEMLLGENLGRSHVSALERAKILSFGLGSADCVRGHGGHGRFTGADIALEEPAHRMAFAEVIENMYHRLSLRAGGGKREALDESFHLFGLFLNEESGPLAEFLPRLLPFELDEENFFEGETFARCLGMLEFMRRMNPDERSS